MAKFCSQCGTRLIDYAAFCTNCGSPISDGGRKHQIKQDDVPVTPHDEIVLAKSNCQFAKGAGFFASHGNILITNKRIVYYKHGVAKTLLLGHAVHLTRGDYDMEIAFSDITSMYWNQQGLSRYLGVHLLSGAHHRIYFIDFDDCMAAITQAMPNVSIPKGE